mmetsp:Transcript_20703/g.35577  ORF Transcript_20703/g.35577 Transcript_20703/m.35577 type:complete len:82 (-) Transcript_20703:417-662(-)
MEMCMHENLQTKCGFTSSFSVLQFTLRSHINIIRAMTKAHKYDASLKHIAMNPTRRECLNHTCNPKCKMMRMMHMMTRPQK